MESRTHHHSSRATDTIFDDEMSSVPAHGSEDQSPPCILDNSLIVKEFVFHELANLWNTVNVQVHCCSHLTTSTRIQTLRGLHALLLVFKSSVDQIRTLDCLSYMYSDEIPVSEARMGLLQCLEVKSCLVPRDLDVVEKANRDFISFPAISNPFCSCIIPPLLLCIRMTSVDESIFWSPCRTI